MVPTPSPLLWLTPSPIWRINLPDGPLVGLPGTPAANVDYYILENAWVVVEGGVAIEVYVDLNSATTGDFDAPQH